MTAAPLPRRRRTPRTSATLARHGLLLLFAALSLYPIVVMWITALRPARDVQRNPFGLPSPPTW